MANFVKKLNFIALCVCILIIIGLLVVNYLNSQEIKAYKEEKEKAYQEQVRFFESENNRLQSENTKHQDTISILNKKEEYLLKRLDSLENSRQKVIIRYRTRIREIESMSSSDLEEYWRQQFKKD